MPEKITEERYFDMLEVLPPAAMNKFWFLVWEPQDHVNWVPRYDMFTNVKDDYLYRGPKTISEFRDICKNIKELLLLKLDKG